MGSMTSENDYLTDKLSSGIGDEWATSHNYIHKDDVVKMRFVCPECKHTITLNDFAMEFHQTTCKMCKTIYKIILVKIHP